MTRWTIEREPRDGADRQAKILSSRQSHIGHAEILAGFVSHFLKCGERGRARCGEIDHRLRIARALQTAPDRTTADGSNFVGTRLQFRHPAFHVVAIRIEALALRTGLKMRKYGAASAPLPAVHCQPCVLLARSASTSVSQNQRAPSSQCWRRFLRQETRDEHAHAIVHPAGRPELAHARIDDRNAGLAALPAADRFRVATRPREFVELRIEVVIGRFRKVIQQMMRKLAPAEFAQIRFSVRRTIRVQPPGDLARSDFAEVQMRRQRRCPVLGRTVAALFVVLQTARQECGDVDVARRVRRASSAWGRRRPTESSATISDRSMSDAAGDTRRTNLAGARGGGRGCHCSRTLRQNGVNTLNGPPCFRLRHPRLEQQRRVAHVHARCRVFPDRSWIFSSRLRIAGSYRRFQ